MVPSPRQSPRQRGMWPAAVYRQLQRAAARAMLAVLARRLEGPAQPPQQAHYVCPLGVRLSCQSSPASTLHAGRVPRKIATAAARRLLWTTGQETWAKRLHLRDALLTIDLPGGWPHSRGSRGVPSLPHVPRAWTTRWTTGTRCLSELRDGSSQLLHPDRQRQQRG